MMSARHFLSLMDFTAEELVSVIRRGIELKDLRNRGVLFEPLKNRVLGMIFEKSSTRTRLSFEAGMIQLGGQAIFLSPRDTQLGRGEPIGDCAIVMSRMLDAVMIRTFAHSNLTEFAANSRVPVINGLSDDLHPCQLLADMQTFLEHRGSIQGKTVAWIGDGNFPGLDGSTIVIDAPDENRSVLLQHLSTLKQVDPQADRNWRIRPVPGVRMRFVSGAGGIAHLPRQPGIALVRDNGDGSALYELRPEDAPGR